MAPMTGDRREPALWTSGDWNAFFGFGTNILVNMLVLTGLLRFVLKMPDSLVYGRILPAFLVDAGQLAARRGRQRQDQRPVRRARFFPRLHAVRHRRC